MARKKIDFEIEKEELLDGAPAGRLAFLVKAARDGAIMRRARSLGIREPDDAKPDDRRLSFVTSNETVDSYGDIIRSGKWDLSHYKSNPLFLWMHNNRGLPIGRSVKHVVDKAAKALTQVFDFFGPGVGDLDGDHAKFADTVFKLYKGWKDPHTKRTVRGLSATSVGFLPKPKSIKMPKDEAESEKLGLGPYGVIFEGQWLKETSGVTVPANPDALITNSYGTLLQEGALTDDDLEVLEAFGLRRDWLCDLRQLCRSKTFVAMCPEGDATIEDLADTVLRELDPDHIDEFGSDEPDRSAPSTARLRVIFDGEEEHDFEIAAGKSAVLRIDRAERMIAADGEVRELGRRDIRRIIDSAIIALTTIAETLPEDDDESGDDPGADKAGSVSRAIAEIPDLIRSLRAPESVPDEEDHLDAILAAVD